MAKGSSSLNFCEKRTILNRISNLARVNLTHTLRALTSHSKATVCLSFRFMDRATLPGYSEPDPLCSRGLLQHIIYNFLSLQESGVKSTGRSDRLLGVPYLWHVASTFKHLTTATTHCGLIKFINTDRLQQIHP